MRHDPIDIQVQVLNQLLQGHYAYYGMAGNMRALIQVYQATESYWHRMLSSRSQKSYVTDGVSGPHAALSLKATSVVHLLSGLATLRDSVKPRLKNSVREIRTLGSVGVGLLKVSNPATDPVRGPPTLRVHRFRPERVDFTCLISKRP